jgi:hypothetical protein
MARMTNDEEMEQRLGRLTPRGVRPELRGRVLDAMTHELRACNTEPLIHRMWPKFLASGCHSERSEESAISGEKREILRCAQNDRDRQETLPCLIRHDDARWLRRAAMAVAASLLLGVALNVWVSRSSERRLAQLFGPPPVSREAMELAKAVEQVTDAQTGRWFYERLTARSEPRDGVADYTKYCAVVRQLIDELQTVSKGTYHDTPQKDFEMDGDHTGWTRGDRPRGQRPVRLDHRYTA